MEKLYADDFNVVVSDPNGQFVNLREINRMIELGAIKVDREKVEEYKTGTRTIILNDAKRR